MNYAAVLFDLDGTLLDTREDVGNAMNRVLASKGLPTHTTEQYGIFLGSGARSLVIRALPEDQRDDGEKRRHDHAGDPRVDGFLSPCDQEER